MSKYIFFSYSRFDSAFALRLAKKLRENGIGVWIDQLDTVPGTKWDAAIGNALREADKLLLILSPHAVASENVADEVSYALDKKIEVVPVLLQPCEVPFRVKRLQYIEFTTGFDAGISRLMQAINKQTATPAKPIVNEKEDRASNVAGAVPAIEQTVIDFKRKEADFSKVFAQAKQSVQNNELNKAKLELRYVQYLKPNHSEVNALRKQVEDTISGIEKKRRRSLNVAQVIVIGLLLVGAGYLTNKLGVTEEKGTVLYYLILGVVILISLGLNNMYEKEKANSLLLVDISSDKLFLSLKTAFQKGDLKTLNTLTPGYLQTIPATISDELLDFVTFEYLGLVAEMLYKSRLVHQLATNDKAQLVQLLNTGARGGAPNCVFMCGIFAREGFMTGQPDNAMALNCIKAAAEAGNINAINELAELYYSSYQTANAVNEAIRLFSFAADQGDNYARERLADLQR